MVGGVNDLLNDEAQVFSTPAIFNGAMVSFGAMLEGWGPISLEGTLFFAEELCYDHFWVDLNCRSLRGRSMETQAEFVGYPA